MAKPHIDQTGFAPEGLVFSGSGGLPNRTYYLLNSTDLTLPLSAWSVLSINQFNASGNFALTNSPDAEATQNFYLLQMPDP